MSGDAVSEILDFESTFETTGEESSKWSDEGCKCRKDEDMELNRCNGYRIGDGKEFAEGVDERGRDLEFARNKHWIWFTVQPRPCRYTEILLLVIQIKRSYSYRTDHVLEFCQDISYSTADDDGADPSSDKPFDCFLWGETDKRSSSPYHSTDICENVVRDDETNWKEEPDQSLKDRIDNEMRLEDDEEKCHVSPTELRKLIGIRSRRQCHDKEHEA